MGPLGLSVWPGEQAGFPEGPPRPSCAGAILPLLSYGLGGHLLAEWAGSGPSWPSGYLCPQFLDLMETIDKQREEMARSNR